MKTRKLIEIGKKKLIDAGIEEGELEAKIILAQLLNISQTELITHQDDIPEKFFFDLINLRASGKPLQSVLGEWDFYGRKFFIRDGVFIPRPETEGLVELVLKYIPKGKNCFGLEIGIGSGAISCALLAEREELIMLGTDISQSALELSRKNAESIGVSNRLLLILCDIAHGIKNKFDFVVSNPPYVMREELDSLPIEVKHDPIDALDGGPGGMVVMERIAEQAKQLLKDDGFIALEIHEALGCKTMNLLNRFFTKTNIFKDLSGKDRYAIAFMEE